MARTGYKEIKLNDIPRCSPWPARLLGMETWKSMHRDAAKVTEEYDQGSYAHCLAYFSAAKQKVTFDKVRAIEFGGGNPTVCASWGDELYSVKLMRAYKDYYDTIARSVLPLAVNGTTIVELGCGYGYNLAMLKKRSKKLLHFCGGEYSANAVALAGKLLEGEPGISVGKFDFYDSSYQILENIAGPVVIFTAHAIEQIPDIGNLFKVLPRYREKIRAVVHCEPIYELQGDDMLGLMRKRYIDMNDYNRNLMTEIEANPDIIVVKRRANIFGINGLNPTSVVEWRFTS